MKIAGISNNSLVDYPGKIAYVIFCEGCNMNCYYCHNRGIIGNDTKMLYTPDFILSELARKKKFIDGVVITGGEPTLQKDLETFIMKIVEIGLTVKLDTNGLMPDVIKNLLDKNLLDYIAMDIKAPFDKYNSVTLRKIEIEKIEKSINLIMESGINYEFRTTFCPDLTISDIESIAKSIKNAKQYSIQQYRKPEVYEYFYDKRLELPPHSPSEVIKAQEKATQYVAKCVIKGI